MTAETPEVAHAPARSLGGINPKYLKLCYPSQEGPLSRRDLLFRSLSLNYEVVPAVEEAACVAWKRCTRCLAACPQQALAIEGSAATLHKGRCTGCAACLPICPVGAIRHPLLDPERLDAQLQGLLRPDEEQPEPRSLLLVADGEPVPEDIPSGLLPLRLPSIGAVSAWLLLRAFTLGADGIAILACGLGCRHRCDQGRWHETLEFTREVLATSGIRPDRLLAVERDQPRAAARVNEFAEAVATLGPHPLRGTPGLEGEAVASLPAVLRHLATRAPVPPAFVMGDSVPFGMLCVEPERCTLCGACPARCPTGALTFQEEGESSQLLFDHARCIACEACTTVCPEGAVRIERRLEFAQLGQATIAAEDQVARCQHCGSPIAPRRLLSKLDRSLNTVGGPAGPSSGPYCADCRILRLSSLRSDRPFHVR
ncbi:MAG: 4Fe-4S binding protein [Deltaproteobacteria bacterium]|nr:4Fe-4S binding protein [Deltaproteobacteria bacterium]